MLISYKKGLVLDGNNPTMLYAYGGFESVSLTPSFSGTVGSWLELGGVYAANLRGGAVVSMVRRGTKPELSRKQNVFIDFIAAAEFLMEENYTSSDKLAIRGGSNGVFAGVRQATQRPELFQVALLAVGAGHVALPHIHVWRRLGVRLRYISAK
ncbi:prolyl oligopeptidase family serine peptidase [Vibrio lentus]|nr:prolyl oligopeptidase family serine peptidase [Vibrio lentus]